MQARWIAFIVFVWIVGAILGAIFDDAFMSPDQQSTLDKLLIWERVISSDETGWGVYEFAKAIPGFIGALGEMLLFKFNFLEGLWWFRWLVLAPIVALIVMGMIMLFFSIMQKGLSK